MAPVKFGLFKGRSRDQQEQPSTENLLKSSTSIDRAGSPLPTTSTGVAEDLSPLDFAILNLEDDDDATSEGPPEESRPASDCSKIEETHVNYVQLQNSSLTSTSTLDDLDQKHIYDESENQIDAVSTLCDANSSQFDVSSAQFDVSSSQLDVSSSQLDVSSSQLDISSSQLDVSSHLDATSTAASKDLSGFYAMLKKPKKSKHKERQLRDSHMWRASNVEVMQNLLQRAGTFDEQIKWEAIATARGLCTLTDSCACADCARGRCLAGVADGDGGLGSAPLFSAVGVGCQIQ